MPRTTTSPGPPGRWRRAEGGQTTAEYALVILGAAAIAFALIEWAGGGAISGLFDDVLSKILK